MIGSAHEGGITFVRLEQIQGILRMPEITEPSEAMDFIRRVAETQAKQQEQVAEKCIAYLKRKELPTSEEVRQSINSLVGKRQEVLRYHVYRKEWALRQGLESFIRASDQASIDISRHDAALGALAESRDFQDQIDQAVGYSAQKDVVAYCALALGVRGILKEIRGLRSDISDNISGIVEQVFSADISHFIRKLRNNLVHGRVLVPEWSVSYSGGLKTSTGSMMYRKKELLKSGNWNEQSRNYIQSIRGERVHLSAVVREHFGLLNRLGTEIEDLFARNTSEAEKDYWEIEDSHKRSLRRQLTNILVRQLPEGKSPYDYLHRFFDPETLREILRRKRNSKDQVDFMMTLQSTEIDWDDDLRKMLYKIFGVVHDSGD